jgi:fluoride exporter
MEVFVIFFGGGIGASLRYLFSLWANKRFGITYWATFMINILGCLFLGFVATLVINHPNAIHHNVYLFLTTGVAGGFTTFSTFSYENLILLKDGKIFTAMLYMTASLFTGVFGIYLGYLLANLI